METLSLAIFSPTQPIYSTHIYLLSIYFGPGTSIVPQRSSEQSRCCHQTWMKMEQMDTQEIKYGQILEQDHMDTPN